MSKDERIKATRCGRSALKAASYREWTAMNDFLMELWALDMDMFYRYAAACFKAAGRFHECESWRAYLAIRRERG